MVKIKTKAETNTKVTIADLNSNIVKLQAALNKNTAVMNGAGINMLKAATISSSTSTTNNSNNKKDKDESWFTSARKAAYDASELKKQGSNIGSTAIGSLTGINPLVIQKLGIDKAIKSMLGSAFNGIKRRWAEAGFGTSNSAKVNSAIESNKVSPVTKRLDKIYGLIDKKLGGKTVTEEKKKEKGFWGKLLTFAGGLLKALKPLAKIAAAVAILYKIWDWLSGLWNPDAKSTTNAGNVTKAAKTALNAGRAAKGLAKAAMARAARKLQKGAKAADAAKDARKIAEAVDDAKDAKKAAKAADAASDAKKAAKAAKATDTSKDAKKIADSLANTNDAKKAAKAAKAADAAKDAKNIAKNLTKAGETAQTAKEMSKAREFAVDTLKAASKVKPGSVVKAPIVDTLLTLGIYEGARLLEDDPVQQEILRAQGKNTAIVNGITGGIGAVAGGIATGGAGALTGYSVASTAGDLLIADPLNAWTEYSILKKHGREITVPEDQILSPLGNATRWALYAYDQQQQGHNIEENEHLKDILNYKYKPFNFRERREDESKWAYALKKYGSYALDATPMGMAGMFDNKSWKKFGVESAGTIAKIKNWLGTEENTSQDNLTSANKIAAALNSEYGLTTDFDSPIAAADQQATPGELVENTKTTNDYLHDILNTVQQLTNKPGQPNVGTGEVLVPQKPNVNWLSNNQTPQFPSFNQMYST